MLHVCYYLVCNVSVIGDYTFSSLRWVLGYVGWYLYSPCNCGGFVQLT